MRTGLRSRIKRLLVTAVYLTSLALAGGALPGVASAAGGASVPNVGTSTVTASPTGVPADGTSASTITVTLLANGSRAVSGKTVTLAASKGSSVISTANNTSNSNGVVTFTVTDAAVDGAITYTATDATDSLVITQTATVTFTAVPSASRSTISASPTSVPADNTTTAKVTVAVKDNAGNLISAVSVRLTGSAGTSSVISPALATADGNGVATFNVRDNKAEVVTYTASIGTTQLSQTAQVTFVAVTDPNTSTVTASPTAVPADGVSASTVTVTLRNASGAPVANKWVSLTPSLGSSTGSSHISTPLTPTNLDGVVTFTVTDATAEGPITYTAKDTTDDVTIIQTAQITFTGPSSASDSTVSASPSSVPADGTTAATVTVAVYDTGANPVPGVTVTLAPDGGYSTISPASATTNDSGVATFTVTDKMAEEVTYTATAGSTVITATATVDFTQLVANAGQSTVSAEPAVVPMGTTATIDVTLRNDAGVTVSGKDVTLTPSDASSNVSAASGSSDINGVVTFTVSSSATGPITYTATDTTDGVTVTQTAVVTFTALPSASTSTVTASPLSVPADGATAATVTVAVYDDSGDAIPGLSVSLAANSGTSSTITPATAVADSNGIATFQVTNTTPETVTYTATAGGTPLDTTAQVTFTPLVSSAESTVTASPTSVPADGASTATVSVTLRNDAGTPVSGKTVALTASGGSSTISAASGPSDASGVVTFTVRDTVAEGPITYTATDTTDNVTVGQAQVTFTAIVSGGGGGIGTETGGSTSTNTSGATPAAESVGSDGGTLTTEDGAFSLTIPAGALTGDATLAVAESTGSAMGLPQGLAAASATFTLTGAALTTPQQAVIKYDSAALGGLSAERLSVYALGPDGTWTFVPTAVDPSAGTASVKVGGPATLALLVSTTQFRDVPATHWATGSIDQVLAASVVTGFPDGTFQPDAQVTRAQFVAMLAHTLRLAPASGSTAFGDVDPGAWYAPDVAAAVRSGLVNGVSPSSFAPDATVTRQEMAVLLARAFSLSSAGNPAYQDSGSIGAWAAPAVQAATAAGYLAGFPDGTFRPADPVTRAQAAKVLAAAIDQMAR